MFNLCVEFEENGNQIVDVAFFNIPIKIEWQYIIKKEVLNI